jgi:hypothetical protein
VGRHLAIVGGLYLASALGSARAQTSLPEAIDAAAFRALITSLSEPGGFFADDNHVSNELGLQRLLPELAARFAPGGAYLGVGPEQNFSYIANLRPGIAFIVDIRHQNLLEQLLYKALFEQASNRSDFLAALFSRAPPADLGAEATAAELLRAFRVALPDRDRFAATLEAVIGRLTGLYGFEFSDDDRAVIARVLGAFLAAGPNIAYVDRDAGGWHPNYVQLMEMTDASGANWSYLGSEASFERIRRLQLANLVVPVVGDFAGPVTLRAIGNYLLRHGATVDVFYASNVEAYLFEDGIWQDFHANLASLPVSADSLLIRTLFGSSQRQCPGLRILTRTPVVDSLPELVAAGREGRIASVCDLAARSR